MSGVKVLNARVSSSCGSQPMTWKPSISMLPRSRMQIRLPLDLLSQERQKGFALEVKRIRASSHIYKKLWWAKPWEEKVEEKESLSLGRAWKSQWSANNRRRKGTGKQLLRVDEELSICSRWNYFDDRVHRGNGLAAAMEAAQWLPTAKLESWHTWELGSGSVCGYLHAAGLRLTRAHGYLLWRVVLDWYHLSFFICLLLAMFVYASTSLFQEQIS